MIMSLGKDHGRSDKKITFYRVFDRILDCILKRWNNPKGYYNPRDKSVMAIELDEKQRRHLLGDLNSLE